MGAPKRWVARAVLGALLAAGGGAPTAFARLPDEDIPAIPPLSDAGSAGIGVATAPNAGATRLPGRGGRGDEPRTVTMAFSGDTLVHSQIWTQAAADGGGTGLDFRPMLAPLRVLLDPVDVAVCHLESPIAPDGVPYSTAPVYAAPAEVAWGLAAAGYDRCSTASNHALDQGVAGIDSTIGALQAAGLDQSGMARVPEEIEPTVFLAGGVAIAHLSYTFGFNGIRLPADQPWRSALIETDRIIADSSEARRRGAEVVVLSLHWGEERNARPTAFQRSVAETLTAAGAADLIVGHHAHVIQPIEQINGTWVAFGLGNLLSNMPGNPTWPASTQDGVVVTVGFVVDPVGRVTVERPTAQPTWVSKGEGWRVLPVLASLDDPVIAAAFEPSLRESLERTRQVIGEFIP